MSRSNEFGKVAMTLLFSKLNAPKYGPIDNPVSTDAVGQRPALGLGGE